MDPKCRCPHCGTKIRYQLELSSTLANCPGCKTRFQLPDAPAMGPLVPASPRAVAPLPAGEFQNFNSPARRGLGGALLDPMDSQPAAMQGMGKEGTLTWGFLFCVAFPVAGWLAFWRGANVVGGILANVLGGDVRDIGKPDFMEHIEVVTELIVFVAILFGLLVLLNTLRGSRAPVRGILFTTGLVLLPFIALFLYLVVLSFLKIKSGDALEVLGYLTTFLTLLAVSSFFLLILASLTSVIGFTRKAGFWLTPAVLMVTFLLYTWVSKLTGEIGELGDKKKEALHLQEGEKVILRSGSVFLSREGFPTG